MSDWSGVVGRLFWDAEHPSPWVSFPHVTAYRRWARDVRRARPGTRTEYAYVGSVHSAASLLRIAERER